MQIGKFTSMIGALGAALLPITASATVTYNAAADFSGSSNPNGVWSYGWSQTLGSSFNPDTAVNPNLGNVPGVVQWQGNQPAGADGNPSVFENTTPNVQTIFSIVLQPGALAFHPGSAGQYSIIQFTAPTSGSYLISAAFQGDDKTGPTSTGVNVLVNGTSVWSGYVNGFGPGSGPSYGSTVQLSAGQTLDFAVDYNGGSALGARNGIFYNDSTGIAATITAVPEPTTMVGGALLLLPFGLGAMRRLRGSCTA